MKKLNETKNNEKIRTMGSFTQTQIKTNEVKPKKCRQSYWYFSIEILKLTLME